MYRTIKRLLDFSLALIGGVVFSPLLIVLIIAVKLDSKGPVLFLQKRIGRGKRPFRITKFRTMRIDAPHDTPTHLLHNPDQYITRVGRFLRKSSLDELPQLWHILIGDMSFIGPRPALWNQYDLIAARDQYVGRYGMTINDLRPGLSGWAQINGRDELPIPVKVQRDKEYVEQFGFIMDCRCFIGTIVNVLRGQGVVEGDTGRQK